MGIFINNLFIRNCKTINDPKVSEFFLVSGEVQKEWRSATDGSVITSSAKVGIAVAQQRAPPAVPPPPHSSAEQTTSAAVAAAASSYYASQAQ